MTIDREQKTKEWMKTRARPGMIEKVICSKSLVVKPGIYNKKIMVPRRNDNDVEMLEVEIDHLHCPCDICGHEYSWECEEERNGQGCLCCSSLCT